MKRAAIFLFFFFGLLFSRAQNKVNLVVFAEDGDPFYAFVNGVKQNQLAQSNVTVTDISPNISLRIEFENKSLPVLKQNMSLDPGYEHTAKIKRDKNNILKLRYFGKVPVNGLTTAENPAHEYNTAEPEQRPAETKTAGQNSSVGQGGAGIVINIVPEETPPPPRDEHRMTPNGVEEKKSGRQLAPGNDNTCKGPMGKQSFQKMKSFIESQSFSETRMNTAKVSTSNACLSVTQVKEIASLMMLDSDKLAYAKYAYDHCVDKANFYQVSEIFSFNSTKDELNKFLGH
jgi:hypothetical protein